VKRHALPAKGSPPAKPRECYTCACVGCGNASHKHPLCRKHRRMLPEGMESLLATAYAAAEKLAQHRTKGDAERTLAERAYRDRLSEAVALVMQMEIDADDLKWRINA
jgi:hypothetical protein